MKPKILLLSPSLDLAEPFQKALEMFGFLVTVSGISSTADRAPRTEEFDLVIWLWETNQLHGDKSCPKSPSIDALFLVGNPASLKKIQTFQNGVYRLSADGADIDKFVHTIRELLFDPNASWQRDEQPASSIKSKLSGDSDLAGHPASSPLDLIGQSPQIEKVRDLIKHISQFPCVPVLITGATGTGKEVVARLLHHSRHGADRSARLPSRKPFIAVNCGAIPKDLFESLFFGYCKGAFTGATADHAGYVRQAQGGTLFLDEISTLTLSQQVKLLRFLQDGRYTPVGGIKECQSDANVVAASNEDLKALVAEGRFREDLYYRLNVFEIILSPLQERGGDILLLAEHFLRTCPHECGAQPKKLARKTRTLLLQYHYPGNVRELQHIIEKAIIAAGPCTIIRPEHMPLQLAEAPGHGADNKKTKTLRMMEREHILTAYKNCGCNIKETARQLDIARNTLRERLDEYDIRL